MGFLDRLFGGREDNPEDGASPQRGYPNRSRLNDPGVGTLTDLERCYPLPAEFEYRERAKGDFVVVQRSDGREYVFLVEEGILAWDEPYTRKDGARGSGQQKFYGRVRQNLFLGGAKGSWSSRPAAGAFQILTSRGLPIWTATFPCQRGLNTRGPTKATLSSAGWPMGRNSSS
jgi:hypothetical protein